MSSRTSPRPAVFSIDDALFDRHRSRGYHPERPERLGAARRAMGRVVAGGVQSLPLAPRDASDEEILRAHAPGYLNDLLRLAGHESSLDPDTYVGVASVAAARRAAGAAVALVEALLSPAGARLGAPPLGALAATPPGDGEPTPVAPTTGVALLRPPGHHATRATGMGFCLLNNVAVAAYAALDRGLTRVALVDWDVHHGNGTQDIFRGDPRVLYLSLHQYPFYPGTGASSEVGEGEGTGYTVNVPLSAGAGDAVYARAFEQVVVPVLGRFAPELVLVSAGFDAHHRDPLASMSLTEAAFAGMARDLAAVARESAGGRIAFLLEGGYDLAAIESSLAATVAAATGTGPVAGEGAPEGGRLVPGASEGPFAQAVSRTHADEIAEARRMASRRWPGL